MARFDAASGLLTIDLATGGSVQGRVSDDTEIACRTEDEHEVADDEDDVDAAGLSRPPHRGGDDDDEEAEDEDDLDEAEPRTPRELEGDLCSAAHLIPGTPVHEAELTLTSEGPAFEAIELVG